ncbi:MAG: ATP-dependent sacrificial sulfur transferase LarE [Acidobacteria bacterium]|nr:ATP-dependent sacrificial sulfur transferase LarE [Acidobacteriota bacterium]
MSELEEKQGKLESSLRRADSLLVAYSGGVDSAYLAYAAHRVLGSRMLAVTALSPSYAQLDREEAEQIVARFGIPHEFVRTDEVEHPAYRANNPDRCFFCKDELFHRLDEIAADRHFAAVAYGMNVEDQGDWRPGQEAARRHRVLAPLLEAGLRKEEIRELARHADIPAWDRPASACLASRIAYGIEVTPERLETVEQGEAALRRLGFRQFRVRHHDELVRIEIAPEELQLALDPEMAKQFLEIFKSLGFRFVTLDLEGYRQGSLNLVHLATASAKK